MYGTFKEEITMLVLSRKAGERIHIGASVSITVVSVQGNKVRIGIAAPKEIPVMRAELNDFLEMDSSIAAVYAHSHCARRTDS
jgi:carbon storage regulator